MRPAVCRGAIVLIVVAGLSACATQPSRIPSDQPQDLATIDHWQARGRIGVSGAQGGGSGSFEWLQDGDRADVQIRGPVGIGSVKLQVQGDVTEPHVTLQTGEGAVLESQAAWDELEARLGAPVPAGRLRFWMLGLAAPGEHEWSAPAEATKTLVQDGWRIEYQKYSTDTGTAVPVRMRASSGATSVRIVIDRWQLP